MRRVVAAIAGVAALGGGLVLAASVPASAGGFPVYKPSDSSYPQKVDFVVECYFVADRPDDPIVFPGQPGKSHQHTFGGNLAITASSTPEDLYGHATNCKFAGDTASYWMPTFYNNGQPVYPEHSRAYYRAGTFDGASIQPMPAGLRMIAGNAMSTAPQDARIAGYQCRDDSGNTVPKRNTPPQCPTGDFLESSVVFPNCWNGLDLDSANHKSHMAYADWKTHVCPAGFPVQIPQLTYANRYPVDALRGTITLATMPGMTAGNSPNTLHADVLDAWDPYAMAELTKRCINSSIGCEDITNNRLPPGYVKPTSTPTPTPTPTPPVEPPAVLDGWAAYDAFLADLQAELTEPGAVTRAEVQAVIDKATERERTNRH